MANETIRRSFAGHDDEQIFRRVDEMLAPYCDSMGLKKQVDEEAHIIDLQTFGVKGQVRVEGGEVDISLDYSMFVPKSAREAARSQIEDSLDRLFSVE